MTVVLAVVALVVVATAVWYVFIRETVEEARIRRARVVGSLLRGNVGLT